MANRAAEAGRLPSRKRVTLSDLAARLGLSTATVSRALRDDTSVNTETRSIVRQMAESVGYPVQPSRSRPGTAGERNGKKGIALVQALANFSFEDQLLLDFVSGMSSRTYDFGRHFHLIPTEISQEETCYASLVASGNFAGFVLLNARPQSDWRIRFLVDTGQPFVVHGKSCEAFQYPVLDMDFAMGHRQAAEHLLSLGHRRIVLLNSLHGSLAAAEWERGYRDALLDHGVTPRGNWIVNGPKTEEFGFRATLQFLDSSPQPTAMICSNVISARGVIQAVQERGLRLGDDFSLIAYDDQLPGAFYTTPLTTIFAPCRSTGQSLIDLLERAIGGEAFATIHDRMEPELIVRASTGPAPDEQSP